MEKNADLSQFYGIESILPESSIHQKPNEEYILSERETCEFSSKLSDFFEKSDYFGWILRNSHGFHDYKIWSTDSESRGNDICAIKEGDTVTFKHMPGHGWHNIMINTSQILNHASAAYLLTNNRKMARIVEQYCKGITATMKGMVYDYSDSEKYVMARNIIPENHSYKTITGRKKIIDYSEWRNDFSNWNAQRFNYKNNPEYGDIFVTNIRSKDDLPHLFRAAAFLPYIIEKGMDSEVVNSAKETLEYLSGFCQDIVKRGYKIRSKDSNGKVFMPKGDLASFVCYGKNSEKNAIITSKLIAENNIENLRIGKGSFGIYELFATRVNYYNYKIVNGFHMSAILHMLNNGMIKDANKMITGLKNRSESMMKSRMHEKARQNERWLPDLAVFLLKAGACGMELKKEHAKIIFSEFSKAIDSYSNFERWDLWDDSVPDGIYGSHGGYKPLSDGLVYPEQIGFIFEYLFSPYKKGNILMGKDSIISKNIFN